MRNSAENKVIDRQNSSESLCNWIFEYADFGIILTDTKLDITDVNRWIEKNSGRDRATFKNQNIYDAFPQIKERRLERYLDEALNGASVILSSTFHGYFVPFSSTEAGNNGFMKQTTRITPILNEELVNGLIIHIEDVTERIVREQLLERKNTELQKLNSEKDKFFSIVSHDLRSPFTAMIGYSELLLEADLSEKSKYLADMLHTSIKNLYRFLENLLSWSMLQTGRHQFLIEDVSLGSVISHILKISEPLRKSKEITIFVSCHPQNILLKTDYQALTTIIFNLLFNALKFTHRGGTIEILALKLDGNTEIIVKDNGIGIPEDRIKKLFRIDQSISTQGTNEEKGSGIGLILVKEILTKLNGSIDVQSVPGEGSSFTITLPPPDSTILSPL